METSPKRGIPERARDLALRARESVLVQAGVLLALYSVLWPLVMRATTLAPDAYAEPSILAAVPSDDHAPLLVAALLIPLTLGWRRLRWEEIDAGRTTRVFVFALALVLGWTFATYGYNLFFDQAHTVDRLVLLALTGLVLLHPGFAVAQLIVLLVVLGQLMYPLPEAAWHWPDKRLPVDCLILFAAFLYVRMALRARAPLYLFGVLCLVGATYCHAAIEKMRLGPHLWSWPLDNHLSNIFVSAHTNGGWLRGVSDSTIVSIAQVLERFELPMGIGTILIELSPFALLLHPRATRWIPAALIALHASIWATSGIFFWKWMILHGVLIWYAHKLTRTDSGASGPRRTWCGGIYRWSVVVLFVLFVVASRWILFNVPFAWVDSRASNFFVIRGVGESGETYRIDPRFFAPYDLTVQQSRYYYVANIPVLVGTYGSTSDWELAERLERATVDEIPSLVSEYGRVHGDSRRAQALAIFLQRSVTNAMERGHRGYWLNSLAPPYHFQTTLPENAYAFQEPLVAVTLTFEEWFYDGERLVRTREVPVVRIPVQRSGGGP